MEELKICAYCGEKKPVSKFRHWRTLSGEIHSNNKCTKCFSKESNARRKQAYEMKKRLDFIHSLTNEELIDELKRRGL